MNTDTAKPTKLVNKSYLLLKNNFVNLDKFVSNMIYALAFVLPMFFFTFTFDALSLNKTYLVIVVALLALVLQISIGLLKQDYKFNTVKNYVGIIVLLVGIVLSTLYSNNRHVSLFGTVGKYEFSLLYWIGLSVLAFVVSNEKISLKKALLWLSSGVAVTSILSILLFLNVKVAGVNATSPNFNLIGDVYNFKLLQLVSSISLFYYLATNQIKRKQFVWISLAFWMLSSFALLMFGDLLFSVFYLLSMIVVSFYSMKVASGISGNKKKLIPAVFFMLIVVGLTYIPLTKKSLNLAEISKSPRLTLSESWIVTASVIKDYPLVGTGLGTQSNNISIYKPLSVNNTDFWNYRFNTLSSDLLLMLSNAGVIGMVVYLIFWVWLFKSLQNITKRDGRFLIQLISLVLFAGSLFMGLGLVSWFAVFVIAGLAIKKSSQKKVELNTQISIGIALVIALIALGALLYQASFVYKSQYHFKKAILAKDYITRYQEERLAIDNSMLEAVYRNQNANTTMAMAYAFSNEDGREDDVSSLVQSSILETRIVTEQIDPNNSDYWETRAFIYSKLLGIVDGVGEQVILAATNAVKLNPNNPRLWMSLGNYYYAIEDKTNAAQAFAQAVQLKNDYPNAHYNLAIVLVDLNAYKDALTQLQITARLVVDNKEDLDMVNKSIDTVNELISKADTEVASDVVSEDQLLPEDAVIDANMQQEGLSEPGVGDEEKLPEGVVLPDELMDPEVKVDESSSSATTTEVAPEDAPLAKPSVSSTE